jgi:hypothetical protein
MLVLSNSWALIEWFSWLDEEMNLRIGQDYVWAWHETSWAIQFRDSNTELLVLLKTNGRAVQFVKDSDGWKTDQ